MHFLQKAHHTVLCLAALDSTSVLSFGIILSCKIPPKKQIMQKKYGIKLTTGRTLVCSVRIEATGQSFTQSDSVGEPAFRQALKLFPLPVSTEACNSAMHIVLGVTSTFQLTCEFANTDSVNHKDRLTVRCALCMFACSLVCSQLFLPIMVHE